jgi:hypothetical protein
VFRVKGWSHIFIEGFCLINLDYEGKHSRWTYGFKGNKDPADRGKLPNPFYDPKAKPDKKPKWCKGQVCPDCLHEGKMCEHLGWSPVPDELRNLLHATVHKHFEDVDRYEEQNN